MISPAYAQAAGPAPSALVNMLPLVLIFIVFYFLLIRPQQQKAKEHSKMLTNLKLNDEVITSGGLYGRITQLGERAVQLEVAPKVSVKVDRQQIATLVSVTKGAGDKPKDK